MPPLNVESRFLEFCRAHFHPGASILIAVSGGSDSIALLRLFGIYHSQLQLKTIGVIHVNHGLRGDESDLDEQFVRDCAQQFDMSFFVKRLSGKTADSSGIEAWARKERYSFFKSVMDSAQFDALVTAHTLDDQAETILMRLMRGSGIRGLRGILPVREDRVYRPLLTCAKKELESWLGHIGQNFRVDSSNADTHFHRNRIRHNVIPLLKSMAPDISENLVFLGDHMYGLWENMVPEINKWVEQFVIRDSCSSFSLDKQGIVRKNSLSTEALRSVFEKFRISVTRNQIDAVFENADKSGEYLLSCGWAYRIVKGRMLFYNRNSFSAFKYNLNVPGVSDFHDLNKSFNVTFESSPDIDLLPRDNCTVVIDQKAWGGQLVYRSAEDNDLFQPFGKKHQIQLKEFLSRQGIAQPLRQHFGIVTDQYNKILWVPGIRISEQCRVSEFTTDVIKISMKSLITNI
ncbi:MAG TPA: tRNA lysidine(34) synthetase TilS [Chitinispirillaceae bacterium]|nr:tRNA lysidine(34) synthetase TilS [Chitinispirillaceae bacterium]